MRYKILLLLLPVLLFACGEKKQEKEAQKPDPQITELQNQFTNLAEENRKLREEIVRLREDLANRNDHSPVPQDDIKNSSATMTVEDMKKGLQPLLKDVIQKVKSKAETSPRNNQFGMRVEYDLPGAIYGLVENSDPLTPYQGKVIVRYEKFLESENVSRSYGKGTTTFLFSYHDKNWFLTGQY